MNQIKKQIRYILKHPNLRQKTVDEDKKQQDPLLTTRDGRRAHRGQDWGGDAVKDFEQDVDMRAKCVRGANW